MSRYRTPGEPEFVAALGWAVWNFLYLEESIVRWLWLLCPDRSLTEWRKEKAFEKGMALGREVKHFRPQLPVDLRRDIKAWVTEYQQAVKSVRNAVAHGHAFTVEDGPEGWKPGLAYTDPDGRGSILAQFPDDLHAVAARIDDLMAALSDMEPRLQVALPSTADRAQLNRGEDLDVGGA